MLVKRLMVIAYKMSPVSYFIVRRMGIAKLPFYTLPNLLARRRVVEEFVQEQVTADILGPAMQACLTGAGLDPQWEETFDRIHSQLRGGGSQAAAAAVLEVAGVATA
jgi:lipid-A-disaccharide synthase